MKAIALLHIFLGHKIECYFFFSCYPSSRKSFFNSIVINLIFIYYHISMLSEGEEDWKKNNNNKIKKTGNP